MSGIARLEGNQARAVDPEESVWLSASAGTGKTHVLTSRVLRLLLQPGVEPSQILCLTFTKAGAAEMAERINEKLAAWVRMEDTELFHTLNAIGAPSLPPDRKRARTLFTSVLDCPGGGLRIDTIHAFAQWLLAAFPFEAGLIPGARAMEDRERVLLARQVLSDLLVEAESDPLGDPELLRAVSTLSLRMGPDDVEAWLLRCAQTRGLWDMPEWRHEPIRPSVNRLLGLAEDADESDLAALCSSDRFDLSTLRQLQAINAQWKVATGQSNAALIGEWLALDPAGRVAGIDDLYFVFFKKDGDPRSSKSQDKIDPAYPDLVTQIGQNIMAIRDLRCLLALAERLIPALRLGRAFALAWEDAKQREGLIDFDDQIRLAAGLLARSDMADWIRYKLDRRFDHILVDEAQDTNQSQWDIIFALAGEFWAGLGQRDALMRTLFVVGDYKQAIFRFQGTSPENFRKAADRVRTLMGEAARNARDSGSNVPARELLDLGLDRSFRTAQPVLDFVDAAIVGIGHENFGLDEPAGQHEGDKTRPGYVALWHPVGGKLADGGDDISDEDGEAGGDEGWLSRSDRRMADNIAQQVRDWLDRPEGFPLVKGRKPGDPPRRAGPGDVMVLVRRRRELAGLIVARLHAAGVPVAGVDRLRIGAPLAVRDLVAGLRFAAQPFDCLNLASLLVSPLIGWTQEQLLEHGYRDKGVALWSHLRQSTHPEVLSLRDRIEPLLARADYEPVAATLHWLLTGPWQGRRQLVSRLGHEANDPIDELINAALAYATTGTPSLVGFLQWFDAGDGELKREADASRGLVRVMTVHGSKGLQAPIVILADAAGKPGASGSAKLDLPCGDALVPVPGLRSAERAGRIAAEHERIVAEELQEHWRLLYVAMTRAEEALFIGGALTAQEKEPHADSWYARLQQLFPEDGSVADPLWGARWDWGVLPQEAAPRQAVVDDQAAIARPAWLGRAAPDEPRPARPLAPSALGEDQEADPPLPPTANMDAARQGVLLHRLLERLPDVPPERRSEVAEAWLARNAAGLDAGVRDGLARQVLAVLGNEEWSAIFAPGALAEVPIAAVVGDQMVVGTIDRLLIEGKRIRLVDFKTARRPPTNLEQVPGAVMRQMAAYVAALEATYPEHSVEAALLYTSAPRLIALPQAALEPHKRRLTGAE